MINTWGMLQQKNPLIVSLILLGVLLPTLARQIQLLSGIFMLPTRDVILQFKIRRGVTQPALESVSAVQELSYAEHSLYGAMAARLQACLNS